MNASINLKAIAAGLAVAERGRATYTQGLQAMLEGIPRQLRGDAQAVRDAIKPAIAKRQGIAANDDGSYTFGREHDAARMMLSRYSRALVALSGGEVAHREVKAPRVPRVVQEAVNQLLAQGFDKAVIRAALSRA